MYLIVRHPLPLNITFRRRRPTIIIIVLFTFHSVHFFRVSPTVPIVRPRRSQAFQISSEPLSGIADVGVRLLTFFHRSNTGMHKPILSPPPTQSVLLAFRQFRTFDLSKIVTS